MSAGAPSASDPPGTLQDPRRVHRQQLDEPRQRDDAGVHEPVEAQRHRRLEADDAERRAVELDVLLVVVMRRVIGGDDVDAAVDDARCSIASRSAASRSGGFIFTFVSYGIGRAEHLVGEHEVMRRRPRRSRARRATCPSGRRRASAARSCARCGRAPPVSSASAMSRSAMIDSASPGMPRRPERRRVEALRARRRRP